MKKGQVINFSRVFLKHLCHLINESKNKGIKNAHYSRLISYMFYSSYLLHSLRPIFPGYGSYFDSNPPVIDGSTVKRLLKTPGQVIYPQNPFKPSKVENEKRYYLTSVPKIEVTELARIHKKLLEGDSSSLEDRLARRSSLKLPSLKKRKFLGRQEAQSPGSKKARASDQDETLPIQEKDGNSKISKAVADKTVDASPEASKSGTQKIVDDSSKRSTRASGSAPIVSEVPKKKIVKKKKSKVAKLTIEQQEELLLQEALKLSLAEAQQLESWEGNVDIASNDKVLDELVSKQDLVLKLSKQGIYKKVNFDEVPRYVIDGPKHAKNIPYTVSVQKCFSKILFDLSPKTNCIEDTASASKSNLDETPVVSFKPSPESMKIFAEHVKSLIAETGVESSGQKENISQEEPEANAENATSNALPHNISPEKPSQTNPASPTSNDSEKTLSDHVPSPIIKPVVEPITDSGVESTIPELEKAKLQQIALDLEKPSPHKSPVLTPDQNTFVQSFHKAISTHVEQPLAIIKPTLEIPSSSTHPTLTAITQEDVERVLSNVNNKIREFHQKLPTLSVAPSEVLVECNALSTMCMQMFSDYSLQYERDYIINIARQKFIQDKVEAARLKAQLVYEEKLKIAQAEAEAHVSTMFAQEMRKLMQVETESTERVRKAGSDEILKRLEQISANVLKQLQEEMLNPSSQSQP
jgi:hypothetical protein